MIKIIDEDITKDLQKIITSYSKKKNLTMSDYDLVSNIKALKQVIENNKIIIVS